MLKTVRGLLALGLLVAMGVAVTADEKDEMVTNPKYKFWANFKPGTTSTYHEVTKFSGPEKDNYPGGKDEKKVVYKLQSVGKNSVVVITTIIEEEFLGTVESAPTKLTFPHMIKKANLEAVLDEFGSKEGKSETVKLGKEEIKCKVLAGSYKRSGATVDYKLHYSDTIPGGIVKRTRLTKEGDKVVAETTILLESYNVPKPKDTTEKPKEKDKGKDKGKDKDKEKPKDKDKEGK